MINTAEDASSADSENAGNLITHDTIFTGRLNGILRRLKQYKLRFSHFDKPSQICILFNKSMVNRTIGLYPFNIGSYLIFSLEGKLLKLAKQQFKKVSTQIEKMRNVYNNIIMAASNSSVRYQFVAF